MLDVIVLTCHIPVPAVILIWKLYQLLVVQVLVEHVKVVPVALVAVPVDNTSPLLVDTSFQSVAQVAGNPVFESVVQVEVNGSNDLKLQAAVVPALIT